MLPSVQMLLSVYNLHKINAVSLDLKTSNFLLKRPVRTPYNAVIILRHMICTYPILRVPILTHVTYTYPTYICISRWLRYVSGWVWCVHNFSCVDNSLLIVGS